MSLLENSALDMIPLQSRNTAINWIMLMLKLSKHFILIFFSKILQQILRTWPTHVPTCVIKKFILQSILDNKTYNFHITPILQNNDYKWKLELKPVIVVVKKIAWGTWGPTKRQAIPPVAYFSESISDIQASVALDKSIISSSNKYQY